MKPESSLVLQSFYSQSFVLLTCLQPWTIDNHICLCQQLCLKAACAMQTDGIQPMVTLDDCLEAEDICKADRGFQQLMRDRYDITDLATLACDPWYYGGRYSKSTQTFHFSLW